MQKMTLKHTRELDVFFNENKSNCTLCKKPFLDGDCAHLGYLQDNAKALLCDDCSMQLQETVVRYHWTKDVYEKPNPEDKLWRYMDLSKFIYLISKNELYFPSAACFDDPFEGAKGLASKQQEWNDYYTDFFKQAISTAPKQNLATLTIDKLESESKRLLDQLNSSGEHSRTSTFINCWHLNNFESEAMWKLYSKDFTNAVAIQTTTRRLYEALDKNPYIEIGKVNYIDFSNRFVPVNGSFWFKRKSFEYEKEVRAVMQSYDEKANGLNLSIQIDTLIENIYISPYAPAWFTDVVKSVLVKYNIDKSLLQSDMCAKPFY